jgi:hypothetical protein
MANQRSASLGSLTAPGVSATVADTTDGETLDVYISGTFVGTVVTEASADGTNFAPVAAGLTAPGIVRVPATAKKVRLNVTAFTSGTIVGHVGIEDNDRLG